MSKEIRVGLFAIISGAILYLGFNYLKGVDFFSPVNKYYALYQNIDGLQVSNPVIVNGFAVGRVSAIRILQSNNHQIVVEMDVDREVSLNRATKAILANSDFLGSKSILLKIGDSRQALQNGDTLSSGFDKGLAALFENAEPITANLAVTIKRINDILIGMEGAGEDIKHTIKTLDATLGGVNTLVRQNSQRIKTTFEDIQALIKNANATMSLLPPILKNTEAITAKVNGLALGQTVSTINATLDELQHILAGINQGKGSVGKLMNDDSLYHRLNHMLLHIDSLVVHFNESPRDFLKPLGRTKKQIEKARKKQKYP